MRKIAIIFIAGVILWLDPGRAACQGPPPPHTGPLAGPPVSTLSVIPFYGPEKIWALYTPLLTSLKKTTGLPWELKLYPNHDALIEGLCGGEITIALLGPVPLGRASMKCGAEPLLVALGRDGKPTYRSILVTSAPSVPSLAKLRGATFAFFKGSTAAHIIPAKMLLDAGIGMDAVRPLFYESQDRIMTALLKHEVRAAGIKESLFRKFRNERLRVLKISDPLPNFAFCATPAADPRARKHFISALSPLRPLTAEKDAGTVKDWDDEIKNGFTIPSGDYRDAVVTVYRTYGEVMHEDR